eukprot:CCRYP_018171-RA/>CCRYP_018171-RA protein AED:0.08 eAED:0.08 QI:62/1/1/1/0.33/0.5/4/849/588
MMQRKNKSNSNSSNNATAPINAIPIQDLLPGQQQSSSSSNNNNASVSSPSKPKQSPQPAIVATVRRPLFGTSPFARNWLNVDCCGLVCAGLTYALHGFGCYAFGWILVPSGWTLVDEDGNRELSMGGVLHRTLFLLIAFLAVSSHFKAMTTDPGAVPPDANPLPEDLEELDWMVKGEQQHQSSSSSSLSQHHVQGSRPQAFLQEDTSLLLSPQEGKFSNADGILSMNDDIQDKSINLHRSGSNRLEPTMAGTMMAFSSTQQNHNNNAHGPLSKVAMAAMIPPAVAIGAVASTMMGGPSTSLVAEEALHGTKHVGLGGDGGGGPMNHVNSSPPPPPVRGRRMCRRCQAFKPPRAHHCSICKRCIIKMDHHCPWVNNCVGIGNHKFFLLFIFYTSLTCIYSLAFITSRFFHCVGSRPTMNRCVDHASDLLPLIGLTVEALLFGLFTICMMVDQWDVVVTNLTHIDRLKGEYHHPSHQGYYNSQNQHAQNLMSRSRAGVHEVFGAIGGILTHPATTNNTIQRPRFHYSWLSPFHKVCFPDPIRDDIFGYCRPCGGLFAPANFFAKSGKGQSSMEMVERGESSRVVRAADIV